MFWHDHAPPHFHAVYAEYEALVDIRNLTVIENRALSMVMEWASQHQQELLEDWELCSTMQTPKKNRTAEVEPKPLPKSPWRITFVEALPDFRLRVRFVDGLEGYVDMAQFVSGESAGVFSSLRDENLFRQVQNELGVVTWPNGLDLAPDAMHQAIGNSGCWLLS